jgi:tRNA(Ile)-lysidine synthase
VRLIPKGEPPARSFAARAISRGFAAAINRLGPFGRGARIAAAVSGGADSMALALLADTWIRERGGSLLALVVDHGLRTTSATEAADTIRRLGARDIPARLLTLTHLASGPALAERARQARYQVLLSACADEGILHLLLGHHAADQSETVMMRALGRSGSRGLAAMPALTETPGVRLLRPLLGVPPHSLRAFLRDLRIGWIEDPSNIDMRALRSRLRRHGATHDPDTCLALAAASRIAGHERVAADHRTARWLAAHAEIRPEGFALLPDGPMPVAALAALIQAITGAPYAPSHDAVARIAASPRPVTVAGARLLLGGRFHDGLILMREEAAIAPAVAARPGVIWDNRFRLERAAGLPDHAMIGSLGAESARFRRASRLPAAVLRTLPAIRCGNLLAAVPHLVYPDSITCARMRVVFSPVRPVAGAPNLPA